MLRCMCRTELHHPHTSPNDRGHGTQTRAETGALVASVAGVVERVDQLVTVKTLRTRYVAEVGDVVVGRVAEVRPGMFWLWMSVQTAVRGPLFVPCRWRCVAQGSVTRSWLWHHA